MLDPEKTFTLELKDAASAAVCHTDDGYGYVIMPLARDRTKAATCQCLKNAAMDKDCVPSLLEKRREWF